MKSNGCCIKLYKFYTQIILKMFLKNTIKIKAVIIEFAFACCVDNFNRNIETLLETETDNNA